MIRLHQLTKVSSMPRTACGFARRDAFGIGRGDARVENGQRRIKRCEIGRREIAVCRGRVDFLQALSKEETIAVRSCRVSAEVLSGRWATISSAALMSAFISPKPEASCLVA